MPSINKSLIPFEYRAEVHDFWQDEDGFWIMLNKRSPYCFGTYSSRIVCEDSVAEAIAAFKANIKLRQ